MWWVGRNWRVYAAWGIMDGETAGLRLAVAEMAATELANFER
jgi:hypothetical protein